MPTSHNMATNPDSFSSISIPSPERVLSAKSNVSTTSSTISPKRVPSYAELAKSSPQSPPKSVSSPSSSSLPLPTVITEDDDSDRRPATSTSVETSNAHPYDEDDDHVPPVEISMALVRDALGGETNEEALLATHSIHLEWRNITAIGDTLSLTLHNLRDLYLQHNFITKLEGFELLHNLEFLAVGGNRITTIENIHHLHKLKVFDIHSNRLTRIDKSALPLSIRIFIGYDNPVSVTNNYDNYKQILLDTLPECIQIDHTDIDRPSNYKATLYDDVEENIDHDDNDEYSNTTMMMNPSQQRSDNIDEEEDEKENEPTDDNGSHNHSPNSKGGSITKQSSPSIRKRVSPSNRTFTTTSPGSVTSSHSILRESTVSPKKINDNTNIDNILTSIQELHQQPSLKPDTNVSKDGTIGIETNDSLQRYTVRRNERTSRIQLRVDKESLLSGELNKVALDIGEQQLQEARERLERLRTKITDRTKQRQNETNQILEQTYNPQRIHNINNATDNHNSSTSNTALEQRLAQVRDWRSLLNP